MCKTLFPAALMTLLLCMTTAARAQTKISGTNHCAKPDPQTAAQIGDRPSHALMLGQVKCSWTRPWEIGGVAGKEGIGSFSGELTGDKFRFHAYYVDQMANGDKAYYKYHGIATLKDGMTQTEVGTWTLTGGTGKLKGTTGKGSYKGKAEADGTMTYEVEGEWTAAAAKKM